MWSRLFWRNTEARRRMLPKIGPACWTCEKLERLLDTLHVSAAKRRFRTTVGNESGSTGPPACRTVPYLSRQARSTCQTSRLSLWLRFGPCFQRSHEGCVLFERGIKK